MTHGPNLQHVVLALDFHNEALRNGLTPTPDNDALAALAHRLDTEMPDEDTAVLVRPGEKFGPVGNEADFYQPDQRTGPMIFKGRDGDLPTEPKVMRVDIAALDEQHILEGFALDLVRRVQLRRRRIAEKIAAVGGLGGLITYTAGYFAELNGVIQTTIPEKAGGAMLAAAACTVLYTRNAGPTSTIPTNREGLSSPVRLVRTDQQ
jgi:hypothetical protein